ncbi:MAG: hypothetical protein ABSH41_21550 [Syntrophobacteraceae bacterium]
MSGYDLSVLPDQPKQYDLSSLPDQPKAQSVSPYDEMNQPQSGEMDAAIAAADQRAPVYHEPPPPPNLLRENAPQIQQDVWDMAEGGQPTIGPLRDQQLRPDVGHATGIRQNLGVGFGLGLDAVMANVIRHVSELPGSPEEQGLGVIQQDPARSMALYNATLTAMNKFMMIDKLAPPETFADALARGVGESGAPLVETMALSYLTAGVMNPLTAGVAQKVPYLYSWLFPIARDAITFGAQSALEPGATAKSTELGAGTGAIMSLLGPYGRLTRAIGGAALGIGQEYITNPQAQPMDYARNAALMGVFSAIGGAHGITADEAAAGTMLDWAKEKGYSDKALARAIKSQGIGAIANEFAEDVIQQMPAEGTSPEKLATLAEAETSRFPAFVRQNLAGSEDGARALPTTQKIGPEGLRLLAEDLGYKSVEEMRQSVPAFSATLENTRFADLTDEQKLTELSALVDYARKAGPVAMKQIAEDYGYKTTDEMLSAHGETTRQSLPVNDPRIIYKAQGEAASPETLLKSPEGTMDWGQIDQSIAADIGQKAAPIRLEFGKHEGPNKYGWVHIEGQYGDEIRQGGYPDTNSFIRDVVTNFTQIRQGAGSSLVLAKHNGKSKIAFVELGPSDNGDFYTVRSAFPVRENISKNSNRSGRGAHPHSLHPAQALLDPSLLKLPGRSRTALGARATETL